MAVFIKKVNIPQKSDLINIDMTGSGTAQTYRVLKNVSGTIYEVIAMENATRMMFNTSASGSQMYEDSLLDTYLNSTWYNTLSNDAKQAIVDKTFKQEKWYYNNSGSPVYTCQRKAGTYILSYQISPQSTSFGNTITRHIYSIGIPDIIEYFEATPSMTVDNTTINYDNIRGTFWEEPPASENRIWLNTACTFSTQLGWVINYGFGTIDYDNGAVSGYQYVRPAFQIDLSKIDYTFTDGRQPVELKPVSILQKSNNALSRVGMSYKEPRVTDLTGTTWQFNNVVYCPQDTFMTNKYLSGVLYYKVNDISTTYGCDYIYQGNGYDDWVMFKSNVTTSFIQFYSASGWQYRNGDNRDNITTPSISIAGGLHATDITVINWFYANATRIS